MGCIMPFCKKDSLRDAFQLCITGIGTVLTIFTIVAKTTKQQAKV